MDTLTEEEAEAVQALLVNTVVADTQEDGKVEDNQDDDILARLSKKQKQEPSTAGNYMNCDFILASAAEIERVWSFGEKILGKSRLGMTQVLIEALLFLKFNRDFWDKSLIVKAMKLVAKDAQNARYDEYLKASEEDPDQME